MEAETRTNTALKAGLTTAHPGDRNPVQSTDSHVPGSTFFLPVDRILLYDHNVRLGPNPERDRIKASIVASGGLTSPLAVTKRPESDQFMVHQGGNTRLEILQELSKETPPENTQFDRVKVVYEIYTNELDIAVNHDRENNLRGDLSFIEQAKGKVYQFGLFVRHSENGKPSVKDFCRFMREKYGDDVSPELFYRMRYASDTLMEWIPTILVKGRMTLGAIRELISFRKRLQSVWIDHEFGDKQGFEAVFYELLARQDRELRRTLSNDTLPADVRLEVMCRVDYAQIRQAFQNELAEMETVPGADYKLVGLWIGAALNSNDLEDYEAVADLDPQIPDAPHGGNGKDPTADASATNPPPRKPTQKAPARPNEESAHAASVPRKSNGAASASGANNAQPSLPMDVKSLRGRCYTYAAKVAQRHGFAELVVPTPSHGHGYAVVDIFPDHWWDSLPPEQLKVCKECWWILAMCSHVFDLPEAVLVKILPPDSQIRTVFFEQNITMLSQAMGIFGVNTHLAHVQDDDWDDLIALLTAYRHLIATANRSDS